MIFNFLRCDQSLPKFYECTITYHDGTKEVFQVSSHCYHANGSALEVVTVDCNTVVFPPTSYRSATFGKGWAKVVEEYHRRKLLEKAEADKLLLEKAKSNGVLD